MEDKLGKKEQQLDLSIENYFQKIDSLITEAETEPLDAPSYEDDLQVWHRFEMRVLQRMQQCDFVLMRLHPLYRKILDLRTITVLNSGKSLLFRKLEGYLKRIEDAREVIMEYKRTLLQYDKSVQSTMYRISRYETD